ncbi:MAG TPA: ferredoxin reductase family protein [Solirubrobacteraceae bacterium]|jgi:predicted ferric reductase|nr:ferredoxin reductase family protein [Solirubrobacteraceae bacterium]
MNETLILDRPRTPLGAAQIPLRRRPFRYERSTDVATGLAGLGLGATVALGVSTESWSALNAAGGWLTASGRMAGLIGTYLMLIVVLLAGRVPIVERTLGQDVLMRWHRRLAPWTLVLIAVHGTLITLGYAQSARTGALHQLGDLLTTYPGILTATVGFVLLVMAAVTSARIAKRRMRYETWWAVHLYTYLALALSFSHQLADGQMFVGHPLARVFWTALFIATAGAVFSYRIVLPIWRSSFHQLRVAAIQHEAPGVVSVLLEGRRLRLMPIAGGQFIQLRILRRGLWWQAHPYSVSALPDGRFLRITVKDLGDHSGGLAQLQPGTRVAIEGPYGAFTADARKGNRVAMIGAGVGVTPLRALLEDMPAHVDTVILAHAHDERSLVLRDELRTLIKQRGGRLHELLGTRRNTQISSRSLRELIPDITDRDVYICGPTGFTTSVLRALRAHGVPDERIHREAFAF